MPGLRALLWPTLPRRLFGALVLAFGLVAALLALDYAEFKHDMATHPGVQTLADHSGATLADTDELRDAALVTQASAQMLNRMRRESGQLLPGTVEFQLQDANGQTVSPRARVPPPSARARTGRPKPAEAPGGSSSQSRASATRRVAGSAASPRRLPAGVSAGAAAAVDRRAAGPAALATTDLHGVRARSP
jgi:hypothetical protein